MLSERAAWAYIACQWQHSTKDNCGEFSVEQRKIMYENNPVYPLGLCGCVEDLYARKLISDKTYNSMRAKIVKAGPSAWFQWPLDETGRVERIKFAMKHAGIKDMTHVCADPY